MSPNFNAQAEQEIATILSHYPTKQAALLPVLHLSQKEFGWISPEVMELVAKRLDLSPAHVYGVVTFYSMFLQKPPAKYHLQVCRTLPCALMGAATVVEYLQKKLGIKSGETTKDGQFHLTEVECLASCGTAPMMRVNETYHEGLTEEKIDRLLDEFNKT